jgi:hypothetical protein
MKSRFLAVLALSAIAAIAVSVALATPPDPPGSLIGQPPLARGGADELRIKDESLRLKLKLKAPADVVIARAILKAGGSTGWHGHAGPSLVIVNTGEITMREPTSRRGDDDDGGGGGAAAAGCASSTFRAGRTFVHPEGPHNFFNTSTVDTEFYVVYFVPTGASPAPIDVTPAPPGCST